MRTRTVVCCKPVLQMQVCENKYRTSPPLSEHKAQQCMDDVPPRQSLIETAQFNSVLDQLPVVCVCWFSFSVFCILLNPRRGVIHFHYVPTVGKGGAVFWDIYWDREGERDIGATKKNAQQLHSMIFDWALVNFRIRRSNWFYNMVANKTCLYDISTEYGTATRPPEKNAKSRHKSCAWMFDRLYSSNSQLLNQSDLTRSFRWWPTLTHVRTLTIPEWNADDQIITDLNQFS